MSLKILKDDPYLVPFENKLNDRHNYYKNYLQTLDKYFGGIEKFAQAHKYFGFNYDKKKKGYWFREWVPNAHNVYLVGDFNQWNFTSHPLIKKEFGVWEIFIADSKEKLENFSKIKLAIDSNNGQLIKIPAFIKSTIQNEDKTFDGQFVKESNFKWTDQKFKVQKEQSPIIYEAHIGMATEEYKVGTYLEFAKLMLPKIKKLGYNTIQLMAIQEHPYYGSFGYQVSNFFAPSSRFGSPDDLRFLINKAHQLGLSVILDVVHSHSVKNEAEGLAFFDGTDIYFEGWHPDWDSRLFNYEKVEVKRFLLSNLVYWMEDFHFDGFRFDGVTSMLYNHHGHISFDHYKKYFEDTNIEAILYLQLANTLIHSKNKLSICEDVTGMPGACIPIEEGGLGFDYRLAMGIPDYWVELLKTTRDEDWNMGEMYHRLSNRRLGEKNIAYVESHDQALVGDKTTAFWLMDAEMYTHMSIDSESIIIDRGIALHKMLRFITQLLGGEGYLNFMGNEFGHPEWIDFPREGNNWSYHYARRQWSLAERKDLKYMFLQNFDAKSIQFISENNLLAAVYVQKLYENDAEKTLVFTKQDMVFLFNFSPNSYADFSFKLYNNNKYKIIFTTDEKAFGGYNRINKRTRFQEDKNGDFKFYLPSRSAWVLKKG